MLTLAAELRAVPLGQAVPIVVAAVAWAALYLRGCARVRAAGRPVPGWRVACFLGGVVLATSALVSPLAELADELFWAHMVEHLMLGDLATPQDWPFAGGRSRTVQGIPAGYDENWDGKIDLASVGVESKSWNGVKQMYR